MGELAHKFEAEEGASNDVTDRQRAVLEAMLDLLVEGGNKALTTSNIASKANCSKESLYKWFGDREGLLAAMVAYQAGKVGSGEGASFENYRLALESFAQDLLRVLSSPQSLAMNRLAVGDGVLGRLVLEKGRAPIEARAMALLRAGFDAGELSAAPSRALFEDLYGLIIGDSHIRRLLGADVLPPVAADAKKAIDKFYALYGRQREKTTH